MILFDVPYVVKCKNVFTLTVPPSLHYIHTQQQQQRRPAVLPHNKGTAYTAAQSTVSIIQGKCNIKVAHRFVRFLEGYWLFTDI